MNDKTVKGELKKAVEGGMVAIKIEGVSKA